MLRNNITLEINDKLNEDDIKDIQKIAFDYFDKFNINIQLGTKVNNHNQIHKDYQKYITSCQCGEKDCPINWFWND